jgi:hypothetical protein
MRFGAAIIWVAICLVGYHSVGCSDSGGRAPAQFGVYELADHGAALNQERLIVRGYLYHNFTGPNVYEGWAIFGQSFDPSSPYVEIPRVLLHTEQVAIQDKLIGQWVKVEGLYSSGSKQDNSPQDSSPEYQRMPVVGELTAIYNIVP